jgi:hypothetical protein
MSVCTGTRVPRKTGVPPRMSGVEVMRNCFAVAITHPVGERDSIPADKRMQFHRCGEPAEDITSSSLIPTRGALGGEIAKGQLGRGEMAPFSLPDLLATSIHRSGGRASLTQSNAEDFGGFFHIPGLNPQDGAEASLAGTEAGHRDQVDLG